MREKICYIIDIIQIQSYEMRLTNVIFYIFPNSVTFKTSAAHDVSHHRNYYCLLFLLEESIVNKTKRLVDDFQKKNKRQLSTSSKLIVIIFEKFHWYIPSTPMPSIPILTFAVIDIIKKPL